MNNLELYHYGVKRRSGRYKWGSGDRPYQGIVKGTIAKVKQKKAVKKRNENLKKAREKAAENRKLAADKDRVLRSGSAKEVMRYKGKLTNKELQEAVTRLNLEKSLSDLASKEVKGNMAKIDSAMKKVKKLNEWTKTGTDMYNQIVKVYNNTPEGRRNPLRPIRD